MVTQGLLKTGKYRNQPHLYGRAGKYEFLNFLCQEYLKPRGWFWTYESIRGIDEEHETFKGAYGWHYTNRKTEEEFLLGTQSIWIHYNKEWVPYTYADWRVLNTQYGITVSEDDACILDYVDNQMCIF